MLRVLSHRSLLLAAIVALAPFALGAQATASITCKDGTTSAATGRGACSGHGGVDKSAKATKSSSKASTKVAKADSKAAKAAANADSKAVKADTKTDVKADTKSATKSAKAAEKTTSKAVASDVKETGKSANATVATASKTGVNTDPTNATAKCKDGTYSHAATHRGACSRHGGVAEWLKS